MQHNLFDGLELRVLMALLQSKDPLVSTEPSGDILAGFLVVLLQVRTANFLLALFGCEFHLAQSTEVAQCPLTFPLGGSFEGDHKH